MTTDENERQALLDMSIQIALCAPDGAVLHHRIAQQPGGKRVAMSLPGSTAGSRIVASELATREHLGAIAKGFCLRLLRDLRGTP